MRIFLLLNSSSNSSVANNSIWKKNLYEPLIDLGHEVVFMSALPGYLAMKKNNIVERDAFSQMVVDRFKEEHIKKPFQIFFSYVWEGMINFQAIEEIKNTNVITMNFSCNNIHQFDLVRDLSKYFDICLHSEKKAKQKFLDVGANPVWFQMAANPTYYHPIKIPRTIDVSFVGMNYARRSHYLKYLLMSDIDVRIFGPGWYKGKPIQKIKSYGKRTLFLLKSLAAFSLEKQMKNNAYVSQVDNIRYINKYYMNNLGGIVSDEKMISLYSESKISLGFLEVFEHHDPSGMINTHLHLREFEAPMSGALYCTGYSDELAEFFEPEKEVITYKNEIELTDKIKFYLKHENLAQTIRIAGFKRAIQDNTYQKRFTDLFNFLGIR